VKKNKSCKLQTVTELNAILYTISMGVIAVRVHQFTCEGTSVVLVSYKMPLSFSKAARLFIIPTTSSRKILKRRNVFATTTHPICLQPCFKLPPIILCYQFSLSFYLLTSVSCAQYISRQLRESLQTFFPGYKTTSSTYRLDSTAYSSFQLRV
jgi:hypothetical protein